MSWNQGIKPGKAKKASLIDKIKYEAKMRQRERAAEKRKWEEERERIRASEEKRAAEMKEKNRKKQIQQTERKRAEYKAGVRSRFDDLAKSAAAPAEKSGKTRKKSPGRSSGGSLSLDMPDVNILGSSGSSGSKKKKKNQHHQDPLDMGFDLRF